MIDTCTWLKNFWWFVKQIWNNPTVRKDKDFGWMLIPLAIHHARFMKRWELLPPAIKIEWLELRTKSIERRWGI